MTGKISITIQEKQVGLYFGMPANRMFFIRLVELYGDEAEFSINESDIAFLAYCGYYNHCMISDLDPVFTKGNFIEWMDEMSLTDEGKKTLEDVAECYKASRFTESYMKSANEAVEEAKKKLNGISSSPTLMESSDLHHENITG